MRFLKTLLSALLLTAVGVAQTTVSVTGNLKTLFAGNEQGTAQACITLAYPGSATFPSPPRVGGAGIIVPVNTQCVSPNGSGVVSFTLYGNDVITVGGQTGATYYIVEYYLDAQAVSGANYVFNVADSPVDLSVKLPMSVPPVVTAPTGDNTYCRLDGSNCGFTGTPTFLAGLPNINSIRFCNAFAGSDIGAKCNAALADAVAARVALPFLIVGPNPSGDPWTYSTDIFLNVPATLHCDGATLAYSGTGDAVKLGPNGLLVTTANPNPYTVDGCTFTNGGTNGVGNMAEGIFVNEFVIQPRIQNNYFHNFGNCTAYSIFLQGENWDTRVINNVSWLDGTPPSGFATCANVFLWTNAADPANGSFGDNGQSQITISNNHIQNGSSHTDLRPGVYLNGLGAKMTDNNIAGFEPNVQIGAYANEATIIHLYGERFTGVGSTIPAIMYGDSTGVRVANCIDGITIQDSLQNLHHSSFGINGDPIGPATGTSCLTSARFFDNIFFDTVPGDPMVVENNLAGQFNNYAARNKFNTSNGLSGYTSYTGLVHTTGASIASWIGEDEEIQAPPANGSSNGSFNLPWFMLTPQFAPTVVCSNAGGSLVTGSYFIKISYNNTVSFETAASPEATCALTGPSGSVTVTPNGGLPVNASGYTVYSSITTGTEKQQTANNACVNIGGTASCVVKVVGIGGSPLGTTTAAAGNDPSAPSAGDLGLSSATGASAVNKFWLADITGKAFLVFNNRAQTFTVTQTFTGTTSTGGGFATPVLAGGGSDAETAIAIQCGLTADQNCDLIFLDHTGALLAQIQRKNAVGGSRLNFINNGNAGLQIDTSGFTYIGLQLNNSTTGHMLESNTAPTISAHFNTSGDSISANNGTAAFTVTVGSGVAGSTGAVGLPTAATGWICNASNRNRGAYIQQTGSTAATATFTNYGTTVGTPVNWSNGDVLAVSCFAY